MRIILSPEQKAYLNVGCGDAFFPEWTNLDLRAAPGVQAHDLRRPLPFADHSFDAVYSSHVLEHLTPDAARAMLKEQQRVLKPGCVCRVVVPDLEGIAKLYLDCLNAAAAQPTQKNILRYRWMLLELIDQMVRDKPGGLLREVLEKREYDEELARARVGDRFDNYRASDAVSKAGKKPSAGRQIGRQLKQAIKGIRGGDNPHRTGEVHKWMYDRLGLSLLLTELGFQEATVKTYDQSDIPHWDKYNLDKSKTGNRPRKPDSLFMECRKRG